MAEFITRTAESQAKMALSQFMNKVYGWMALGLVVSALSSYYIASDQALQSLILGNRGVFITLIVAQFAMVLGLGFMINRLSATAARAMFIAYAFLTGTTLSVIFMVYTAQSIVSTFTITAASFAGLSFFGYVTKRDLGPIGTFCIMGLWGIIILALASFFIPALRTDTMQLTLGAVGVIVFAGLTAYDTQKIKTIYLSGQTQMAESKQAILGALTLYLDFINLFLSLLRLMGERK